MTYKQRIEEILDDLSIKSTSASQIGTSVTIVSVSGKAEATAQLLALMDEYAADINKTTPPVDIGGTDVNKVTDQDKELRESLRKCLGMCTLKSCSSKCRQQLDKVMALIAADREKAVREALSRNVYDTIQITDIGHAPDFIPKDGSTNWFTTNGRVFTFSIATLTTKEGERERMSTNTFSYDCNIHPNCTVTDAGHHQKDGIFLITNPTTEDSELRYKTREIIDTLLWCLGGRDDNGDWWSYDTDVASQGDEIESALEGIQSLVASEVAKAEEALLERLEDSIKHRIKVITVQGSGTIANAQYITVPNMLEALTAERNKLKEKSLNE